MMCSSCMRSAMGRVMAAGKGRRQVGEMTVILKMFRAKYIMKYCDKNQRY